MLREETSAAACDSLHHGQVDCILLAKPFACGDVESAKICDDPILIAFPKDDPRDPPAIIDPAMIDEHRLLLLEDGHCLKDHALAACNRPELRASATMMATSLHTLVQLVNNGLGLTMIPQMAIDSGIVGDLNIAIRPLKSPHASREIALLWRRNSPRREEFLLLADIIRRHAVSRSAD
jgi:LysR family hydrogen peroxide-inducible transcriptional activator